MYNVETFGKFSWQLYYNLLQVLRAIPPSQYSYPHGQCRSVGVAGFLLGGGVNWLGTYNKLGYGAESVLAITVVTAEGDIAEVTPQRTRVVWPAARARTVQHTSANNLFFALRGAGSSYGVATQFLYTVHRVPETGPAILLTWADTPADLAAIQVRPSRVLEAGDLISEIPIFVCEAYL